MSLSVRRRASWFGREHRAGPMCDGKRTGIRLTRRADGLAVPVCVRVTRGPQLRERRSREAGSANISDATTPASKRAAAAGAPRRAGLPEGQGHVPIRRPLSGGWVPSEHDVSICRLDFLSQWIDGDGASAGSCGGSAARGGRFASPSGHSDFGCQRNRFARRSRRRPLLGSPLCGHGRTWARTSSDGGDSAVHIGPWDNTRLRGVEWQRKWTAPEASPWVEVR